MSGGSDLVNVIDVQLIYSQQLEAYAVTNLFVDSNNFNGEGIHLLVAFMRMCPTLRRFSSRSCGITSNDLKQLLVLLSKLKLQLSYLFLWELHDNDIDDGGVSALIQHLSLFPNLATVTLSGNNQVSSPMLKLLEEKWNITQNLVHLV